MADKDKPPGRLARWLSEQIVGDVPAGDEICAFDCRKGQCTAGEWETCRRRLDRAAGELMPAEAEASAQLELFDAENGTE